MIQFAATFDDLPFCTTLDKSRTDLVVAGIQGLASALQQLKIPAAGFACHNNTDILAAAPVEPELFTDLTQAWIAAGHSIGNHTDQHLRYSATNPTDMFSDIATCQEKLSQVGGSNIYRAPYLDTGETADKTEALNQYLSTLGMVNVPANFESADWIYAKLYIDAVRRDASTEAAQIVELYISYCEKSLERTLNVMEALNSQAPIIGLFHANPLNHEHFPKLIERLSKFGIQFVDTATSAQDAFYQQDSKLTGPNLLSYERMSEHLLGTREKRVTYPADAVSAWKKLVQS
jgi:peptidoglycan/xylan/chitin deacetylase (PgdA/CDA1 family)